MTDQQFVIKVWDEDSEDTDITPNNWHVFPHGMEGIYLALSKANIPNLVKGYLAYLAETPTQEVCKCVWAVHPDDVDLDTEADVCRMCECRAVDHPQEYPTEYTHNGRTVSKTMVCNTFKPRRKRVHKLDDHPECPMHTESGRILGFFEYLFPLPDKDSDDQAKRD